MFYIEVGNYLRTHNKPKYWICNILNGNATNEKIVYTTDNLIPQKFGFVLLQDIKWDGISDKFRFIAIVKDRNLKSLRDLRKSHLPLLENLKNCFNIISSMLHMPKFKIIAYFRYPPKFLHLHLLIDSYAHHFQGHSYYLSEVIQNINLKSDYYANKTFTLHLRKSDSNLKSYNQRPNK
ncbi:unnamed protein product [Gordionus sp. m RMFG-2023]